MRRPEVLWAALLVGAALPASAESQVAEAQRVELYGFVFGELICETHRTGRDRFLNIQPLPGTSGVEDESADAFFDVAASRIGLNVNAGTRAGATGTANLEVDFDTPDGGPRIRHAFGELTKGRWRLLIGQTWAVVSQLNPTTINSDNLYNLGNTYERVPQIRVSYVAQTAPGTLEVQVGAATFFGVFDQPGLAIQSDPGAPERLSFESNTPPAVQGRLAYGWDLAGRKAQVAVGASAGGLDGRTPSGAEVHASHFLVAGEVLLPVSWSLELMAEGFFGRGGGFNSGVGQTAVFTAAGRLEPLRSWGGFAQLAMRPAADLGFNAIGGIDDPEARPGGTALAIDRNWTVMGNAFWNATERLTYAAELQYLRTEYEALGATADNLRATVALFVHL